MVSLNNLTLYYIYLIYVNNVCSIHEGIELCAGSADMIL